MSQDKYVCIHGHWYQPPRENPFTGKIQDQPSAAPFPNWNERILAECYEPNTRAEILGDGGEVERRLNTYEWVSSDWGPTLLAWIEGSHPDTYRRIIAADAVAAERFDGHGTALAHSYNHTILPLSNRRDKKTQILWGVADFEHRFGRSPEGMWLPEAAVDLESLQLLAAAGIDYTILSPYQAEAVRDDGWRDVSGGLIDTRVPYEVQLPGGESIAVFFYNGPLSQDIAFNGVLEDGVLLAKKLIDGLGDADDRARLSHVATDGETYGHHHRHGEMALAKAIAIFETDPDVQITNYAAFLAAHPPSESVRITEDTSWSCAHGIERWRSNCGCSTGLNPGWDQEWREPLRTALDGLRDSLIPAFEEVGGKLLSDPWDARDHYIEVILGASPATFLQAHGHAGLDDDGRRLAMTLLEMQQQAMLMYTSCGWFFDDISGLESVLVLRHAGRTIDLARRALGIDLEPGFLGTLETARSNVDHLTGRDIYERSVTPYMAGQGTGHL